ncbi:MAG: tyrosine-type recombinase/integrase [Phycisphaera sp. RhM]|nr:tyrosine-type recombinase/integrase [Phycisphaera sp. RhM]
MASLHRENNISKIRYRDSDGKNRAVSLGRVSKRSADGIFRHVCELILAKENGVRPDAVTERWAMDLAGKLRSRLSKLGLVEPEQQSKSQDAGRLLGAFVDHYIKGRTDVKPSTVTNFKHAKKYLVEFFPEGESKVLSGITRADGDRFKLHISKSLAISTTEKIIKRCKTMFTHAVRDRLISENPFDHIKLSGAVNRERDAFIDRPTVDAIIDFASHDDWKLAFTLARYGGLRRCELTSLKWTDILWDQNKLRIESPKTGLRFCPLFPELHSVLLTASENAPERSVFAIQRYRRTSNLGTQANRIIEAAGLTPWPKTFVNLRASRRTELQESFPDHVINAWLGHSSKVAEKHYLQVTPDHWDRAMVESESAAGNQNGNGVGNTSANQAVSDSPPKEKPGKKPGSNTSRDRQTECLAPCTKPIQRESADFAGFFCFRRLLPCDSRLV